MLTSATGTAWERTPTDHEGGAYQDVVAKHIKESAAKK
jgi:hypothetical protein